MESIEPFVYLQRYRLAVCRQCQYAVLAKEILTHLRERHRDIAVEQQQQLAAAISRCPGVIQDQDGLIELQFPPPTISYILELAAPEMDGLKCRKCPYLARQLQKFQKHCRVYHGWANEYGAGRPGPKRKREKASAPPESPALPWRGNVACKRFFRSRNASGWFEVERKSLPLWASKMHAPETCEPSPVPWDWVKSPWRPHTRGWSGCFFIVARSPVFICAIPFVVTLIILALRQRRCLRTPLPHDPSQQSQKTHQAVRVI